MAAAARRASRRTAASVGPGARALVTGVAAEDADFADRLSGRTPLVLLFVLGLAFVLMLAAFRSPALAAAMIALNLLSLGATYGILTAVFQNEWAEGLLGFESSGVVTTWLPLFAFVILFGLSMDYTILVLERIREGRRAGLPARRGRGGGRRGDRRHGDQRRVRDGRGVRDLRDAAAGREQAARRRPGRPRS